MSSVKLGAWWPSHRSLTTLPPGANNSQTRVCRNVWKPAYGAPASSAAGRSTRRRRCSPPAPAPPRSAAFTQCKGANWGACRGGHMAESERPGVSLSRESNGRQLGGARLRLLAHQRGAHPRRVAVSSGFGVRLGRGEREQQRRPGRRSRASESARSSLTVSVPQVSAFSRVAALPQARARTATFSHGACSC